MRIVVAVGGNALMERGEHPDAAVQEHHVQRAVVSLADLVTRGHEVVITHDNGPQIGLLATESAADPTLSAPYPLDELAAQTQGMIGSLLARALRDVLPGREVAALVTHTEADPRDPAFTHPTEFIGRTYTEQEAQRLHDEHGWSVAQDGDGWRRTVPSPLPRAIVEVPVIRQLLAAGTLVICAGGGGVPVVRDLGDGLRGAEAVIDKDRTAALLAEQLDADALLILTDVTHVFARYGKRHPRPLPTATPAQLRALDLPDGSMRPKTEAAAAFVERTGGIAAIGPLDNALGTLLGTTGTLIQADPAQPLAGEATRAATVAPASTG